MVLTTGAIFRRTLFFAGITAVLLAAGCSSTPDAQRVGPPAQVYADEVPILVFWDGSTNTLKAVPESAHLKAGAQRAHWVAVNGESLQISYKDPQAIGLGNNPPQCGLIDCDMKVKPSKPGRTAYSISLTTASGPHKIDPQLIVD
jgi:hypothetical protein